MGRWVSLVFTIWLLPAAAAIACEMADRSTDVAPIESRKPVRGDEARLVSGFGMRLHPLLRVYRMHTGTDWAAPLGTPVIAAAGGRVVMAGRVGEYGNTVVIDHGAGWQTLYAHLSGFDVREGDCIAFDALIGRVGATGLVDGPKLHFEVRRDGHWIDPQTMPAGNEEPG
jgi:murein DD-endopeptidase MepM/ murein hydrolase activator NlpD